MDCYTNGEEEWLCPDETELSSQDHHFFTHCFPPNYSSPLPDCFLFPDENIYHEIPSPEIAGELQSQPQRDKKKKSKHVTGQPSKNLMAERRRRKRLNDRLSMLRSVVPKISKMDRTSILGDAVDYIKELMQKIKNLQQEIESTPDQDPFPGFIFHEKPNEILLKNSPKFDIERRNSETRVEICCGGKDGLLISTVKTLEDLGLQVQHCVGSCFNDFALQASCSQGPEEVGILGSEEDIKQQLIRSAGYQ